MGEVPGPADAVLHRAAHQVRRVDVAVDVGLHHPVHRQAAQPPHQLRVVADLLRAQHDPPPVVGEAVVEPVGRRRAQRQRRGRGRPQHPLVQQVQHPVLDDLGVGGQVPERAGAQPVEHGVGDVADPGLQRQQLPRQPAAAHLAAEEVQHVPGDA